MEDAPGRLPFCVAVLQRHQIVVVVFEAQVEDTVAGTQLLEDRVCLGDRVVAMIGRGGGDELRDA